MLMKMLRLIFEVQSGGAADWPPITLEEARRGGYRCGRSACGKMAWAYRTKGGGELNMLGMEWRHAMQEQSHLMTLLLKRLGLFQLIECSNPNVWTSLLQAGEQSMLFVMNLHSSPMKTTIACYLIERYDLGEIDLPPMAVKRFN